MAKSIGEFRNFVLSKYPNMSKTQMQQLDDFVGQKQAEQALQVGGITLQDIPIEKRAGVASSLISKGVNVKSKQSTEEVKKEQANTASTSLLNQLEREYSEAGGGTFGVGPGARIKGSVAALGAKAGLNDPANVYLRSKAGFAATLKQLTGDVGVLTDKDYARLAGLLPDFGSTEGESRRFFNNLRSQLAAKFGGEKTETTFKPIRENQRGPIASLTDVLFPSATTYAEKGLKGELAVQKKPMSLTDILATGAGPLGVAATRPDIFKETIGPAGEVVTAKGLLGAGGYLKGKIPSLFKGKPPNILQSDLLKGLQVAQKAKVVRTSVINKAQEEGKKVAGTNIFRKIEEWAVRAKRANPTESKTIDKFISGANKQLKGKQLNPTTTKELWDDAEKGFTASGLKGSSLESSYHRTVRDAVRKELDKVAPGFEKATKTIKKGLDLEEILGSVRTSIQRGEIKEGLKEIPSPLAEFLKGTGKRVAGGAATATGFTVLAKMLGLNLPGMFRE